MALRLGGSGRTEPMFVTRRAYLRAPRLNDWPAWAELRHASRDFLMPWEPAWAPDALGRAAYRHRLRRLTRDESEDGGYAYFVFRRDDDALLGGITLSNLQRGAAQSATIGYWIGRPHAGQGYMTESLGALLDHAFGPLGMHRLEAACVPENTRSKKLLERCGFRQEGYARQYLRINGVWHDHLLFALLAGDYRAAADRLLGVTGVGR